MYFQALFYASIILTNPNKIFAKYILMKDTFPNTKNVYC